MDTLETAVGAAAGGDSFREVDPRTMALSDEEATRVVQFCLAGDGWGVAVSDQDSRVLKVVLSRSASETTAYQFEGATFEAALAAAVDAGVLKSSSVEKQVAFISQASSTASDQPMSVQSALFAKITAGISALVHETQRERGVSALYAASKGQVFGSELTDQWVRTDRRSRELFTLRRKHAEQLPAGVARDLKVADRLLAQVVASRGRVKSLGAASTELIEVYSKLNGEILAIIDDLSRLVANPLQRPSALAWMALLYAKEKTGIERAQLASAFARDQFIADQRQSLPALIAGRECYLHLFGAAAPPNVVKQLRQRLATDVTDDVARMERIALSHHEGRFGVDAASWFSAMTRLMDGMAQAEGALRLGFLRA